MKLKRAVVLIGLLSCTHGCTIDLPGVMELKEETYLLREEVKLHKEELIKLREVK